ncbi:hypothetical protein OHB12_17400 [Nocardia sp. NBC_01730]|uniref:hypothetical protein n=1 Tax=Nocardia sp. NBC_01730 TaxID=2975998 RepID=UPI002E0E505E|nr:hypothetical protein OHB12_17400 [Nocardia sp. NBC_01730]
MSSHNRKSRPHTGRSGVSQSGRPDGQAPPPADNPATSAPADSAATDGADSDHTGTAATPQQPAAHNNTAGQRLALIGPTSEATRRWVAESRTRQGLTPHITDPIVLESLALFLRNALDTLDRDRRRDDT